MTLEELKEKVESISINDIKLYFISREIKPGVPRSYKASDKYLFKVYQIDCNQEIRNSLHFGTCRQFEKEIKNKYDIVDYDILSDETEHLFSYSIEGKAFSFSDVVTNQLQKICPRVTSISHLLSDKKELWAYCVEFASDDDNSIYTFRKILPSKIGIAEKKKKYFRTIFDTESQQLSLLKEETINLDEQIDCIFYVDTFYVLQKNNFEQITCLHEEIKQRAKVIADEMIACGNFVGGDNLKEMIENKPGIHKKLIKVGKIGGYKEITPQKIRSMKKICNKYGDNLPVLGDQFTLNSEKELDIILKAFGDYYKIGEISGKPYGTFAGKELMKAQ